MAARFLMNTREALDRRRDYLGQLRRHENTKRNASIAAYWKSKFTAAIQAGAKQRTAAKSATDATSKEFDRSPSQIRRARKDAAYLMSATSVRHRLRELNLLARDIEHAKSIAPRIARFEFHMAAGIKAGHSPAEAYSGAIAATAYDFEKDPGTIRRNLAAFGIRRPPKE